MTARVAIVGGGVTGALAAYYLTAAGVDCVMVDRRDVARGSTAASTGMLQYEIDKPLVESAGVVGHRTAARAYRLGVEALDEFERLTGEVGDDCGFARTRSLLLASDAGFAELLRRECDARREIGLRADYLSAAELRGRFGFERPGAILSAEAAQVDPVRLTTALIGRATARGLRAFGGTQVERYEGGAGGVTLTTDAGRRVRAEHVLFATGYETPEFLADVKVALKSTYALGARVAAGDGAESPVEGSPLLWETGMPYFYARTDGPGRLIAGGEDDAFHDPATRDARLPQKTAVLVKKLRALYPRAAIEVDCAWAGTFAETPDALPYVGPHPAFGRGLFALGYGGNGITFGLIAARLLRDRILGVENPDAELFRFDR